MINLACGRCGTEIELPSLELGAVKVPVRCSQCGSEVPLDALAFSVAMQARIELMSLRHAAYATFRILSDQLRAAGALDEHRAALIAALFHEIAPGLDDPGGSLLKAMADAISRPTLTSSDQDEQMASVSEAAEGGSVSPDNA